MTLKQQISKFLNPSEEDKQRQQKYREEQQRYESRRRLITADIIIANSNLPIRLRNFPLEDYIITKNNSVVNEVLDEPTKSYYIFGECGTGKTILAGLLAKQLALFNFNSLFFTVGELFYHLNPYNYSQTDERRTRKSILACDCLIIDDLGAEKSSAFTNSVLFDIVNNRYNAEKQIIFTSNFNIVSLQKRWGDYEGARIGRRITEMCVPIQLLHF